MSVEIAVDLRDFSRLSARLSRFERSLAAPDELLENVAGLLEAQTKRRISDEKTAPDGKGWREWSKQYARTRKPHHSLLIDTQALLDDIAGQVNDDAAVVGSSLVYAGRQHKMRPFLGISNANEREIERVITDWLDEAL